MATKENPKEMEGLNPEVASQMLSNIFDVCNCKANSVPLEVMSSYQNYSQERNYLQRGVILAILLLLLALPMLFIRPVIEIEQRVTGPGSVDVFVSCDSPMPVKTVTARIGEYCMAVRETETGDFRIIPNRNGSMTVEITLVNRQTASKTFEVTGVDQDPPELVGSSRKGDLLTIYFADDSGELKYDEIFAKNGAGEFLYPVAYDPKRMSVTFVYPNETINIFVQDKYGNSLQLILSDW